MLEKIKTQLQEESESQADKLRVTFDKETAELET